MKRTGLGRLRRYLLIGLVLVLPVGATIAILVWLFRTLDAILGRPLQGVVGMPIPGVGLVLLLAALVLLGWLAHYALGRRLLSWWNLFLARFPLTSRIYNAASQIVQAFMSEQRRIFQRTVLIEFPMPGSWAIAWVTAEENPLASALVGEPCMNVFMATTPNPTSGYLLIVPRSRTKPLDISIEDAMKLVISAGAVLPQAGSAPVRAGLDLDALLRRPRP